MNFIHSFIHILSQSFAHVQEITPQQKFMGVAYANLHLSANQGTHFEFNRKTHCAKS